MPTQSIDFDVIRQIYNEQKSRGTMPADMDLASFSKVLGQRANNVDFSKGFQGESLGAQANMHLDRAIDVTGLPSLAKKGVGGLGGLVDEAVGNEENRFRNLGQQVGESIPRGLAQIGAVAAGGIPLAALGIADAANQAYQESGGSGRAALVGGALTGLAPAIGSVGSKLGLAGLAKVAPVKAASSPVARFIGSEVGQEAAFMGTDMIGQAVQGQNPFTVDNLFTTGLGTVSALPVTIPQGIKAARSGSVGNLETGAIADSHRREAEGRLNTDITPVTNKPEVFEMSDPRPELTMLRNQQERLLGELISPKTEVDPNRVGGLGQLLNVGDLPRDTDSLLKVVSIEPKGPEDLILTTKAYNTLQERAKVNRPDRGKNLPKQQKRDKRYNEDLKRFSQFRLEDEITPAELSANIQKNAEFEGSFDGGVRRTARQMEGMIQNSLAKEQPDFVESGRTRMEEIFNELGMDPKDKEGFMSAADRVLGRMLVDPNTRLTDAEGAVLASQRLPEPLSDPESFIGVYLPGLDLIGLSPNKTGVKGLDGLAALSTLAHESAHALLRNVDRAGLPLDQSPMTKATSEARQLADSWSVEERKEFLRGFYKDMTTSSQRKQDADQAGKVEKWIDHASKGSEEFLTEMVGLAALQGTQYGKKAFADNFKYLPQPIKNFLQWVGRAMAQIKALVTSNISVRSKELHNQFKAFEQHLDTLLDPDTDKALRDHTKGFVESIDPTALGNKIVSGDYNIDPQFRKEFEKILPRGDDINEFEANFFSLVQAAEGRRNQNPAAAEAMGVLTSLRARVNNVLNRINIDFMLETESGKLRNLLDVKKGKAGDKEKMRTSLEEMAESRKMRAAFSKAALIVNSADEGWIPLSDPRMAPAIEGLSGDEVRTLQRVLSARASSNRKAGDVLYKAREGVLKNQVRGFLLESGLSIDEARQVGGDMVDRLLSGEDYPTQTSLEERIKTFVLNQKEGLQELKGMLDKGAWFTEFRTGRYVTPFKFRDAEGKVQNGAISAADKLEMEAVRTYLKDRGDVESIGNIVDQDKIDFNQKDYMPKGVAEKMAELEKAAFDTALQNFGSAEAQSIRELYNPGMAIKEEADNRPGFLKQRNAIPGNGREELDLWESANGYAKGVALSAAKMEARSELDFLLKSPDFAKMPQFKQEIRAHGENVLGRNNKQFSTFDKAVVASSMGANISSALFDLTQPLMTTLPWLLNRGLSVGQSLGLMKDSLAQVAKSYSGKGTGDADLDKAIVQADNEGRFKSGGALNEINFDDIIGFNTDRFGEAKSLLSVSQLVNDKKFRVSKTIEWFNKAFHRTADASLLAFRGSSAWNAKTSFITAYNQGKKEGLKGQALYDYATRAIDVNNASGGAAGKAPILLKAQSLNPVLHSASLLTNYTLSMMAMMKNNFDNAFRTESLTPAQRSAAKKAFTAQMLTQFSIAGAFGMPLVGAALRLFGEMFEVDIETEIRKGLADLDESGWLGETAVHGWASSLLGINAASRTSLADIGPINSYNGFDIKNLLGASGSFVKNTFQGTKELFSGEDLRKNAAIPNGLRRGLKLWADGGDGITNLNGELQIEPTQFEKAAHILGFEPQRLAEKKTLARLLKKADEFSSSQRRRQDDEITSLMKDNKWEEVKGLLEAQSQEETKSLLDQGFDSQSVKEEVKRVHRQTVNRLIERYLKQNIPSDPLRDGNNASAQDRREIAQAFGQRRVPRALELQRLLLKNELSTSLTGKRSYLTPKAIQKARAIDEIQRSNPSLSRQEVTRLVNQQFN